MIDVVDHAGVRELRLCRPPANAIDLGLLDAIIEAVDEARNGRASALVLSGQPGMFSGGLDVPWLLSLERAALVAFFHRFFAFLEELVSCPLPVVAAITGHAPAGGLVVALACDQRVMAAGPFKIGRNEVRGGLPMPFSVLALATHAVGARTAERMVVSGELVDPATALAWGLVDEVVAPEQVVARAVARAASLTGAPRMAQQMTREAARRDLIEQVHHGVVEDPARLLGAWYDDDTRAALAELARRISRPA